jgi:transposase
MVTVKRYMKVYRQQGAKGFYESKPRHSSASKLKSETLARAQQLLEEGRRVPEVAEEIDVLANTIHKAIRTGRLRRPPSKKKRNPRQ